MALSTQEEDDVRVIIEAYKNGKTIEGLPLLPNLQGGEFIELMKGGISYRANTAMLAASTPDANGVYPDVPLNRVTIKRTVGQLSTQVVTDDNVGLVNKLKELIFPCTINRSSIIVSRLNGNDMTKTIDGLPAVLTDWTMPVMVLFGGFWMKYEYNASTNTKVFKYSPYKVRGYRYVRRRFLSAFGGTVVNDGGTNYLTSISDAWTTQNLSIVNYHAYAKNLGSNFRAEALQDAEIYRDMMYLIDGTYNSQSIYAGITNVSSSNWSTFSQAAAGGQSTYGQFHKTGVTLDIIGHKGEKDVLVAGFPGGDITVKPNKYLWRENMLSGPYFIRNTGYLKKDRIWYRVNDLANIDFDVTANYNAICEDVAGTDEGYITETFEGTMIPTMLGGSSTTGLCDRYSRPADQPAANIYIPASVGYATFGSSAGRSCLASNAVVSVAYATGGSALASDDPTDQTPDGEIAV